MSARLEHRAALKIDRHGRLEHARPCRSVRPAATSPPSFGRDDRCGLQRVPPQRTLRPLGLPRPALLRRRALAGHLLLRRTGRVLRRTLLGTLLRNGPARREHTERARRRQTGRRAVRTPNVTRDASPQTIVDADGVELPNGAASSSAISRRRGATSATARSCRYVRRSTSGRPSFGHAVRCGPLEAVGAGTGEGGEESVADVGSRSRGGVGNEASAAVDAEFAAPLPIYAASAALNGQMRHRSSVPGGGPWPTGGGGRVLMTPPRQAMTVRARHVQRRGRSVTASRCPGRPRWSSSWC